MNESVFRIAYFISIFFSGVVFLDIVFAVVDAILMVWGIFIFRKNLKNKIRTIKYSKIILCFLLFSVITSCVNIKMGFPISFLASLVMVYHTAICFFIFYGLYEQSSFEKIKKELFLLFKILLVISTFLVVLGFIVLLIGDSFVFKLNIPIVDNYDHYERVVGIMKRADSVRFTGVFINPNILAFSSVVSIIVCHMLYRTNQFFNLEKKWTKVLFLVLIVSVHVAALILSDSIASFLFFMGYIILWLFYKMILENKLSSIKSMAKHGVIFLVGCLVIVLGLVALRFCFQDGVSNVIDELYSVVMKNNATETVDNIRFGRPNHDISNGSGRRLLLQQAFYIFLKHPLLGIGITNVVDYGNLYFDSGIAFSNFHNGYVSILVCNGLIGFALFMMFLILVLIKLFKFFLKNNFKLKGTVFINLFISVLSYLFFALFEKTLLSEINFMGIFFWVTLGYLMAFFMKYNKKED